MVTDDVKMTDAIQSVAHFMVRSQQLPVHIKERCEEPPSQLSVSTPKFEGSSRIWRKVLTTTQEYVWRTKTLV